MKKVMLLFLSAFMFTVISTTAFAQSETVTCKDFTGFFDAEELAQVIEQTSNDSMMVDIGYTAAAAASDGIIVGEYKEYMVSSSFFGKLAEGIPIKELLPDSYAWKIPSGNSVAKVILKNGVWKTIGYSYNTPGLAENSSTADDSVRFDKINSAIESIKLRDASEITDIICVYVASFFSDFVCVTTENNAYVIPFVSVADFMGFTNGEVYEADEISRAISQTYGDLENINADIVKGRDIDELTIEEILQLRLGGGIPQAADTNAGVQSSTKASMPILPIAVIPAAAVAIAITIMLLIRNKGSRKHTK